MAELYDYSFNGMSSIHTTFYIFYMMYMFACVVVNFHQDNITSCTMVAGVACTESFRAEGAFAA